MKTRVSGILPAGLLLGLAAFALLLGPAQAVPAQPSQASPLVSAAGTLEPRAYLPAVFRYWPPNPAAPLLNPINNSLNLPSYMVTWQTAQYADSYELQEDSSSLFGNPVTVYSGTGTSWQTTRSRGSHHYRVRGVNSAGAGPWSAARAVMVCSPLSPNDSFYSSQWALAKINAEGAWACSGATDIVIAVVDSGVDAGHPDLQAKLLPGRRFYNGGSWDSNWQDYNGHGTHVAGIAAASTNNGQGVAGVGWNNRILPVRVLDSTGSGYTSDVAAGVRWAVDNGARVINMSLGGEGYDPALETATSYAWSHGSLVVAAAGNCGDPQNYYPSCSVANPVIFPAANPNVLAVAATDSADGRPSFSSYGWWVDVAAPGVSVLSTMWSGNYLTPGCSGQAYCYLSGTSMASPAVAGLAALVWARDPAQSPAQVANTIMNTALDLGPQGWDQEYGYGRINAAAAIYAMPSAAAPQTQPMVAQAPAQHAAPRAGAAAQPGIVLVRFRQGVAAAPGLARHKLAADGEIEGLRIIKVKVPAGKEYETAVELLADPDVEFAQPDYVVKAM